jgi:hypothetical protein
METMIVGATLLGSFATALLVQRAVLGVMLRALDRAKTPRW